MLKKILEKFNIGTNLLVIGVFAIAFIYFVISAIVGLFQKEPAVDISNVEKTYTDIIDKNETNETLENSKVSDYSEFYTLQDACENFIQYLIDGEFSGTYGILADEMKDKYAKNEYVEKVTDFSKKAFTYIEGYTKNPYNMEEEFLTYTNSNNLVNLYKISNNEYIAQIRDINLETFKLGFRLNRNNNTYKIFYISI